MKDFADEPVYWCGASEWPHPECRGCPPVKPLTAADPFGRRVEAHMMQWRRSHIESSECGVHNGYKRPWILPRNAWELGLWKGVRSKTPQSLEHYLKTPTPEIKKHSGVHNLKSSWMLCANLYFPFRFDPADRQILAGFLQNQIGPAVEIKSVEGIELEYAADDGPLHPSQLLGETGGSRGAGQTSPDVAFLVGTDKGKGLVLVECKFTEDSFCGCSARNPKDGEARPGNLDRDRCLHPLAVQENPATQCHQAAWGRRYWCLLRDSVDLDYLGKLSRCPAATGGYQLFRQQALAEGMAASGTYGFVASCVAMDEGNDDLRKSLRTTGMLDLEEWPKLFSNSDVLLRVIHHRDWVDWVRQNDDENGRWRDWADWVTERYGW